MSDAAAGACVRPFGALACPIDGDPLRREGAAWRCPSGHSFDVAAAGHVHLLPVQHKRSRDPGDSKEMVAARRRFLESGAYAPIADAVCRAVLGEAAPDAPLRCLDAGCGEGYYLRRLAGAAEGRTLELLGLDISKWAVQAATRREPRAAWVVGSNARLPVLSGTLDRVLCMFGFPVYAEFARVLKAGGELLQVDAGPDHLRELREVIYPVLKPQRVGEAAEPPGFERVATESVRFVLPLTSAAAIADLLAMTPHLYRASAEGRARAAALDAITLTVDVRLVRFSRTAVT